MFDSGKKASELIEEILNEAEIAPKIQSEYLMDCLNSLEQMLYSSIIKEQAVMEISCDNTSDYNEAIPLGTVRYEDIHAVYVLSADNAKQLIGTTLTSGVIFNDSYYKRDNKLYINATGDISAVRVIYYVKPPIKATGDESNVMLPVEYLELAASYLRSQAYKIANEDDLYNKWADEYNVWLGNFKNWISSVQPSFGI